MLASLASAPAPCATVLPPEGQVPVIAPISAEQQVKGASAHFELAQGDVADMLNSRRFDLRDAYNARNSIENGVALLSQIDPAAVPYTHLDSAATQALEAADALKRASDYGFNQGEPDGNVGPVNPNTVQLALARQAFDSLETALEVLDNG